MTVLELNKKLQSFNIWGNVRRAIASNSDKIVDFNRQQMVNGIAPDGQYIRPRYKSEAYADAKADAGSKAPFGIPDLKLTEAFHDALYLKLYRDDYSINSKDEKAGKLEVKYNPFGLTYDNRMRAVTINTRTFSQFFKQHTGLKG